MLKKSILVAAVTAFTFAGAAFAQQEKAPVSPSPIKRDVIGKIEVPNSNWDIITAIVEIAPGFKAGRHLHPGIVQFEVLDGEFWLAMDDHPERVFKMGEKFEYPMKVVHNEGALGDKWAKLVVTYMVERGQPLVQPVK
jgi:quercetin dioxygenase-like cupin family protein